MSNDTTINVPPADTTESSSDATTRTTVDDDEIPTTIIDDAALEETTVSLYSGDDGQWREFRLAPGHAIEITNDDGHPIAYVAVDSPDDDPDDDDA